MPPSPGVAARSGLMTRGRYSSLSFVITYLPTARLVIICYWYRHPKPTATTTSPKHFYGDTLGVVSGCFYGDNRTISESMQTRFACCCIDRARGSFTFNSPCLLFAREILPCLFLGPDDRVGETWSSPRCYPPTCTKCWVSAYDSVAVWSPGTQWIESWR